MANDSILPACRSLLQRLPGSVWSRAAASLFAFLGLGVGGYLGGRNLAFIGAVAGAVIGCLLGAAVHRFRKPHAVSQQPSEMQAAGAVGATVGAVMGAAAGAVAGPAGLVAGASVGSVAGDKVLRGAVECESPTADSRQGEEHVRAGIGAAGGAVLGAAIGSLAGPLGAAAGTRLGAAAGEVVGRHDDAPPQ